MQSPTNPPAACGRWQAFNFRSASISLLLLLLLSASRHFASGQVTGTPPLVNPTPVGYVPPGLHRAGPVTQPHGFPDWYQDKTGLALEFGTPKSQAEIAGGWVLVDLGIFYPETYPSRFSTEHFYHAAVAQMDIPLPAAVAAVAGRPTTRARLVLGHEAGFANLVVEPGAQTVFTRIRIDIRELPYSGTYRITTPYKVLVVSNVVAATRLFLTEDVGLTPPPASEANFNLSLHSKYGPYLLPSNTRGGAELPPVTFEGRSYIADAARTGKITGSPLGPQTNVFRIECWDYVRNNGIPVLDPAGNPIVTKLLDTEVDDFTLTGRIKTDTIPDYVKIDRASYFNSPTDKRVDVFVTSPASLTNRLPAQPFSTLVARPITLYPAPPQTNTLITGTTVLAPPAGVPGIVMARNGSSLFAQSPQIKTGIFPQEVTLMDGIGAIYRARVTDSVYISAINYSPASQTLSVQSISSDTVNPPVLSLSGVETTAPTMFQNGVLNLTGLAAVPSEVGIVSSYGAYNTVQVAVGIPVSATTPTTPPVQNLPPNNPVNITRTVAVNQPITVDLLTGNTDPNDTALAKDLAAAVITSVNRANYGRDFTVSINGITVPPFSGRFPVPYLVGNPLTFSASAARSYVFTFGLVDKAGARSASTATLTINVQ